ncbi:hypothetical protein NDU88_006256, partial [Pleurodeles waltl]
VHSTTVHTGKFKHQRPRVNDTKWDREKMHRNHSRDNSDSGTAKWIWVLVGI